MATAGIPTQAIELYQKPLTAVDIRAQVNLIQEVMRAVMKENTHYGTIPGCKKPSLYKPGSEKLLSTFHIAIEPIVEDLSTSDEARYRVTTRATSSGNFVGSGVGEASSNEEKYCWREAVCRAEFEATPEDRRRTKYKKGGKDFFTVDQVRTNVADMANTVLKMAKKRSQIDVTLTVTAASDIFTQDIEDLPDELRDAALIEQEGKRAAEELPTEIRRKSEAAPAQSAPAAKPQPAQQSKPQPVIQSPKAAQPARPTGGDVISEAQARRFYAMWKHAGREAHEVKEYLKATFGTDDDRMIPRSGYEQACNWVEGM